VSPLVADVWRYRQKMRGVAFDRATHLALLDLRDEVDRMLPPDNFQEDPQP
jgi:hypothetical protein